MAKRYDVIVVGAGPAGLMAAKAAEEAGLEVALLEKKNDIPRLARACLQTLDSANEYFYTGTCTDATQEMDVFLFPPMVFRSNMTAPSISSMLGKCIRPMAIRCSAVTCLY